MITALLAFGTLLALIAIAVRLSTPEATNTITSFFKAGTNIFRGAFSQ